MIQELCTTYNNVTDLHPCLQIATFPMFGNCFPQRSGDVFHNKRKKLALQLFLKKHLEEDADLTFNIMKEFFEEEKGRHKQGIIIGDILHICH
jgi:hypothetical protein